jgi:hypothetical protein
MFSSFHYNIPLKKKKKLFSCDSINEELKCGKDYLLTSQECKFSRDLGVTIAGGLW